MKFSTVRIEATPLSNTGKTGLRCRPGRRQSRGMATRCAWPGDPRATHERILWDYDLRFQNGGTILPRRPASVKRATDLYSITWRQTVPYFLQAEAEASPT
jgi:hypothetical protein